MNVFTRVAHERNAAEFCLRVAFQKLKIGDIDAAAEIAEDAIRSLNELKKHKQKTD